MSALEAGRSALLSDELQLALDSRDVARLAAVLPNAITTMLYSPDLAGAWLAFNGALLRGISLPPRLRELVVLRVAWRCRSEYEWRQHARMAPRYRISEDEVARIATDDCDGPWKAGEADVLAFVDQLLTHHCVDTATWERAAGQLDDAQLVELPFVVGAYATLAMAFNVFRIQLDPQYQSAVAPPIPRTEV
jgi:alkylhydroperoxidase family enzyme